MIIIPEVGTIGHYELKAPLEKLIVPNERHTCKALRKLSDLLANNEEPLDFAYIKNGLNENEYKDDLIVDMVIVSLQSDNGHWLYIPAKYIAKFPDPNGVPYRTLMIGISLPSFPVDHSFTHVINELKDQLRDTLGVECETKLVETSRVVMVPSDKHRTVQTTRRQKINEQSTVRARLRKKETELEQALLKIAELEKFIAENSHKLIEPF